MFNFEKQFFFQSTKCCEGKWWALALPWRCIEAINSSLWSRCNVSYLRPVCHGYALQFIPAFWLVGKGWGMLRNLNNSPFIRMPFYLFLMSITLVINGFFFFLYSDVWLNAVPAPSRFVLPQPLTSFMDSHTVVTLTADTVGVKGEVPY